MLTITDDDAVTDVSAERTDGKGVIVDPGPLGVPLPTASAAMVLPFFAFARSPLPLQLWYGQPGAEKRTSRKEHIRCRVLSSPTILLYEPIFKKASITE